MKNITLQYRDLLEGKMPKETFMRNLRMQFPQWIAPSNNLEDAVSILKGKRILTEEIGSKTYYLIDHGKVVDSVKAPDQAAAENHFYNEYEGMMSGWIVSDVHPDSLDEAADSELEAAKEEARKNSEEGYVQHVNKGHYGYTVSDWYDADTTVASYENGRQINEGKKKPSAGMTAKQKSAVAKKAKAGKDIGKKGKGFEKVAKAAEKQYGSKEAGEKVAAATMWKAQAKKAIKEAIEQPEGSYKKVTGKEQYNIFQEIDRVNPYEFKRGIQIEMEMQYEPTPNYFTDKFNPEALVKATKKVLTNLQKDPAYYTNTISHEFEKKSGLMQDPKELKVKADGSAKVKGFTDAKENVQTNLSKKERAKGKPEGVKEMKPSKKSMGGIKTMKSNGKVPKGVELMKEGIDEGATSKEAKINKLKEYLKKKIKEELFEKIAPEDIADAQKTGDTLNIPAGDTASIQKAKQAKVTYTTYK